MMEVILSATETGIANKLNRFTSVIKRCPEKRDMDFQSAIYLANNFINTLYCANSHAGSENVDDEIHLLFLYGMFSLVWSRRIPHGGSVGSIFLCADIVKMTWMQ